MIPNQLLALLLATAVCPMMACNSNSNDAPKPVEESTRPEPAQQHDTTDAPSPEKSPPANLAAETLERILPAQPHEMPDVAADIVLTQTEMAAIDKRFHHTGAPLASAEAFKLAVDELLSRNIKRDGKVNVVRLELPRKLDPTAVVHKAWGTGETGPDNSGVLLNNKPLQASYWFEPTRGIRTKLVQAGPQWHITWTRYYPVERLIGSDPGKLGIESDIGVIGRTTEQVAADLDAPFEVGTDRAGIYLATPEFGALPVVLRLKLDDSGKIASWKTTIEMGFETFGNARRNELEAAFAKHLGEPTQTDLPRRMWTIGDIQVTVGPTPGQGTALELEVAPADR